MKVSSIAICSTILLIFSVPSSIQFGPGHSKRITGGYETRIWDWPFMVMIQNEITLPNGASKMIQCSGSVLDKWWVLTAAHCIEGGASNYVQLGFGYDGFSYKESDQLRTMNYAVHHPQHVNSDPMAINDIVLIRLSEELTFNLRVSKVNLPTEIDFSSPEFDELTILGYGFTKLPTESTPGEGSGQLRAAKVKLVKFADCQAAFRPEIANELTFCVQGSGESVTNICSGDSGGPAVKKLPNGTIVILGVLSGGKGNCDPFIRGWALYVKVPSVLDWIRDTMQRFNSTETVQSSAYYAYIL